MLVITKRPIQSAGRLSLAVSVWFVLSGHCGAQPQKSSAEVIYSNLGPKGNVYQRGSIYDETGADTRYGATTVSFQFTVSGSDYVLTRVDVALRALKRRGLEHSFLFVVADDAGHQPGTKLFQQEIGKVSGFGLCCKLVHVKVTQPVTLLSGHKYWLEALPSSDTVGGWAVVTTHQSCVHSVSYDGGQTWPQWERALGGAFAVYGVPVD